MSSVLFMVCAATAQGNLNMKKALLSKGLKYQKQTTSFNNFVDQDVNLRQTSMENAAKSFV